MPTHDDREPRAPLGLCPRCGENRALLGKAPGIGARRCSKCRNRAMNLKQAEKTRRCWTFRLLKYARCNRLRRGGVHAPTDLNEADLRDLFERQRGRCWWTGIALCTDSRDKPWSVSLDRLDNEKGYLRGNVVLSSRAANFGRQRATPDEMRAFVEKIREAP